MAEYSAIEWTDATFNPWIGCTRMSPACDDCYAARSTPARSMGIAWGPGQPRHRTAAATWRQPQRWNDEHAEFFAQHGRRRRVFCASLADVFDNEVPEAWRDELMGLIASTPHLDWLLLTKRIGNVSKMLKAEAWQHLPHVWLGATVVNQAEADRDVPKLLAVPARVRFLSIEPMLGSINLRRVVLKAADRSELGKPPVSIDALRGWFGGAGDPARLHWVIAGGESGPKARPSHPDWFRSLRDQCAAAGVPFLFKQWGEWLPIDQQDEAFTNRLYRSNRVAKLHEDQSALDDICGRTCTVPYGVVHQDGSFHEPLEPMAFLQGTGAMTTFKVGKKASGRRLDAVEHNGFPEVARA